MNLFAKSYTACIVSFTVILMSVNSFAAPIHELSKSGDTSGIKRLLAKTPEQVNAQDKWGWTPLMHAVRQKREDVVKTLLSSGARVSITDRKMRNTALDASRSYIKRCDDEYLKPQIAFWKQQKVSEEQISKRIAAHKQFYCQTDRQIWIRIEKTLSEALEKERAIDEKSPLLEAVVQGDIEKVKHLLDKGPYIEIKDEEGRTPLLLAVEHGHKDIVKLLLDHGANMAERDKSGQNAYSAAKQMFDLFLTTRRERDNKYLQDLIKKGTLDINKKDKNGETPLMRAVAKGELEEVKKLLQLGASVNVKNNEGQSLQDIACTRYHSSQLKDQILGLIAEPKHANK